MTDEELINQYAGYSDEQLADFILQGLPDWQKEQFELLLRLRRRETYEDIAGLSQLQNANIPASILKRMGYSAISITVITVVFFVLLLFAALLLIAMSSFGVPDGIIVSIMIFMLASSFYTIPFAIRAVCTKLVKHFKSELLEQCLRRWLK